VPFVKQECRVPGHVPCAVGDLCYLEYKKLIDAWNMDPRWTNAHNITKNHFDLGSDEETANFLAWMVWFAFKVLPYERKKEEENGSI
jgi:hypothetical protein